VDFLSAPLVDETGVNVKCHVTFHVRHKLTYIARLAFMARVSRT